MNDIDSNQQPAADPMDALLNRAFDQALAGPGNPALLEGVMLRIARQERQRMLITGLIGFLAALLAGLAALPLLDLIQPLLSGALSEMTAAVGSPPEASVSGWGLSLGMGVVLALAAAWLFLEEAF